MEHFIYLSFDEILSYYQETIEQSGGGMSGIRERAEIEKVLDFVQDDLYYPNLEEKLTIWYLLSVRGITSQMAISAYHW